MREDFTVEQLIKAKNYYSESWLDYLKSAKLTPREIVSLYFEIKREYNNTSNLGRAEELRNIFHEAERNLSLLEICE